MNGWPPELVRPLPAIIRICHLPVCAFKCASNITLAKNSVKENPPLARVLTNELQNAAYCSQELCDFAGAASGHILLLLFCLRQTRSIGDSLDVTALTCCCDLNHIRTCKAGLSLDQP